MSWDPFSLRIRADRSGPADTPGSAFEITLLGVGDTGVAMFTLGGIAYCVRDREQHLWCKYAGMYVSADADLLLVDWAVPPMDEAERWVQFESFCPARVTDFGGLIALASAGAANPLAVPGLENVPIAVGGENIGRQYLFQALLPQQSFTAMLPSRIEELLPEHAFSPNFGSHFVTLPTGRGMQAGGSLGYSTHVTPFQVGRDRVQGAYIGYDPTRR